METSNLIWSMTGDPEFRIFPNLRVESQLFPTFAKFFPTFFEKKTNFTSFAQFCDRYA
jgi:hypothetical protein